MKKIYLIYNPAAGNANFSNYLDSFINKFQKYYIVNIFRTTENNDDLYQFIKNVDQENCEMLIIAGGDGSVNQIVNLMMKENLKKPLAIIPAGTVNDIAHHLNMPADFNQCFQVILNKKTKKIDIGFVNDRYFINVCIGGMLSGVAHDTEINTKNKLGRIAYYLNGIKEFTSMESFPVHIETSDQIIEEDVYLFMVLNSQRAGGFNNLSPDAEISDGLFELIIVKAGPFYKIFPLMIEIFQNRHLDNKNIIFTRSNYFNIKINNNHSDKYFTDIDGEKGPFLPLEIKVKKQALRIIHNLE